MSQRQWIEAAWSRLDESDEWPPVVVLPIGAVEAHGPHLPLGTDGIIAEAMAATGAHGLEGRGVSTMVLPTLDYTAAPFAAGFRGTVSIRPETTTALIIDIGHSLIAQGIEVLAVANAHFDPTNLAAVHAAVKRLETETSLRVAFPDVTRRPWALRLTDEFKSGACHAGRYEGSVVMAARPDLVLEEVRANLPENATSLSEAIRAGKSRFEEIGGTRAYFGDPAAASVEEGQQTILVLGSILEDAVLAVLGATADGR